MKTIKKLATICGVIASTLVAFLLVLPAMDKDPMLNGPYGSCIVIIGVGVVIYLLIKTTGVAMLRKNGATEVTG